MNQKLELPLEELPEWLGGPKKSNERTFQAKKNVDPSNTMNLDKSSNATHIPVTATHETAENLKNTQPESSFEYPHSHPEYLSLLTGTQFDQQATIMSLQQQEHELKTAVTLSRQSEQLNKMIESQKKRLDDQEKQFNVLIKKQLDRQGLLEAQMKAQQDRINCHLQVDIIYFLVFISCYKIVRLSLARLFTDKNIFISGIIGSTHLCSTSIVFN